MKIIPLPLRLPTPEEIERAKTDPEARKRVSVQRLRVKRRKEEIDRLTLENAKLVADVGVGLGAVYDDDNDDAMDYDAVDYDADNNGDRYVRVSSECRDVVCLAPRTRPFVFTVWDAIAGFFPACP